MGRRERGTKSPSLILNYKTEKLSNHVKILYINSLENCYFSVGITIFFKFWIDRKLGKIKEKKEKMVFLL